MKPAKKSNAPSRRLFAAVICMEAIALPLTGIGAYGGISACRQDFLSGQVSLKHLAVTACCLGFSVLLCVRLVKDISQLIREHRIRRQNKNVP